jgi:hypothetical protein
MTEKDANSQYVTHTHQIIQIVAQDMVHVCLLRIVPAQLTTLAVIVSYLYVLAKTVPIQQYVPHMVPVLLQILASALQVMHQRTVPYQCASELMVMTVMFARHMERA